MRKIAVIFPRLGPYHMARLEAAAAALAARSVALTGIEVASTDSLYAWDEVRGSRGFRRITLFPGADACALPARRIRAAVTVALEAEAPEVVALPGWAFPEALGGLAWCRRRGAGAVLMSESCRHDAPRVAWKEWIKRRRVRAFDSALVGGARHAEYVRSLGIAPDRVFLGYDAVDNAHFASGADAARARAAAVRARRGLPPVYFLASSRFVAAKNLPLLLRAFAAYRAAAGPEAWSLVVCGDGELRAALLADVRRLGIADAVCFPGFVQYPDLPDYYGLASAFVHASTVEPWGLVVNEAMASGLPVLVSSRCGCAPDLVRTGVNGHTFDPSDERALAALLARFAGAGAELQSMGSASRRLITDWGPERFARGLWDAALRAQAAEDTP